MEKKSHDELKEFARLCANSLSEDEEIHQQVESELLDHLESAFEEELNGRSEEQALKKAMCRFGNPEVIASQLAECNAKRLSLHSRIRHTAKWLALPVLLIGVMLCIDIRGIISSATLMKWMKPELFDAGQGKLRYLGLDKGLETRKLSEEEQLLFDYYCGRDNYVETLSRLYETQSEHPMLCALYAQELSVSDLPQAEIQPRLQGVLAKGRKIDPDNSLYDYLECFMLMKEACELSYVGDNPDIDHAIKDRDKLDEAIAMYRRALGKGRVRGYGTELSDKIRGMLKIKEDLLGGMHLLAIASEERLPVLAVGNGIARGVALYCNTLHKEGDHAKAVELLGTWRIFLPQHLNVDHAHVLDIFACFRTAEIFLECATKLGVEEEIEALQRVLDIDKELKSSIKDVQKWHGAGGLLSRIVPPFSMELSDRSEWAIERRLEAATIDSMILGLACLVIFLVIVVFSIHVLFMRLGGRRPFLFIMPKSTYAGLFLKGILLPALIYLVFSHYIAGKGALGILPQALWASYLCLVWPLWYGLLCHRALTAWTRAIGTEGHATFRASRSLNMLCLFAVLLLSIGCILRPISIWRQRHYARMETLVIPREGVETHEKRVVGKWQGRILEILK